MAPIARKHDTRNSKNSSKAQQRRYTAAFNRHLMICQDGNEAARLARAEVYGIEYTPAPAPRDPSRCTQEAGCQCRACLRANKKIVAEKAKEYDLIKSMSARLSPPTEGESIGGDNLEPGALACPDLPRSKWQKMMRDEHDTHPKSADWNNAQVASWHDAYDAMLAAWGAGKDVLASNFPAKCISILADPGITAKQVLRGRDGEPVGEQVYKIAFIRVEDDKVIPLDDASLPGSQDPYPGWDCELQGDPEQGERLDKLTKKHAEMIAVDPETAALTHEQSRELFNGATYRAAYPELDGRRAATREQWRQARKRLVREGKIHKPESDEHYRQGRRWHTISKPYAPGPDPELLVDQPIFGVKESRRIVRQAKSNHRKLRQHVAAGNATLRRSE